MPMLSANPSSRSMVAGSNVSACHISSWLMAVLGMKLHPTGQGCPRYQSLALAADQRASACADTDSRRTIAEMRNTVVMPRLIAGS
jgi:hypothetical protein